MRFGTLLPSLALAVLTLGGASFAAEFPAGWAVFSHGRPEQAVMQCANQSRRDWSVSMRRGKLRIDPGRSDGATSRSIRLKQGLLRGRDLGEFGGGLWWVHGGMRTKLSDENIHGFLRVEAGILAFAGLDHLGMRSGAVLLITERAGGRPTLRVRFDLGESPHAFARASDGTVMVLTSTRLIRVAVPDRIETMFRSDFGLLYPNSLIITNDGSIIAGMRHFVVRLTPQGQSFRDDWFVPVDCVEVERRESDCICRPKSN